jgi:2,3-bisphosphoglycerate-independent phosphoglycerate mutase
MPYRPVLLLVLDGWGNAPDGPGNAVKAADTPEMDRLLSTYPNATLRCSGLDVGLPADQMGNSEVGHLNLGAGRIVYQWITRIDAAIEDGSFFRNPTFLEAIDRAISSDHALHLMGLIGDGGVHASQEHLLALLRLAHDRGTSRVFVHAFMDGRDTPPHSGLGFMTELTEAMRDIGTGRVASICGRYYAMDRDRRWDRTAKAYNAIVNGDGARATDPLAAIQASYDAGVTDEFIIPIVLEDHGAPIATVQDGDSIIVFNFRSDRPRQIVHAIADPAFDGFGRANVPQNLDVVTMTEYQEGLPVHVAFPPENVDMPLARVISEAGKTQFHTAETEKYAHVTYFLNGGREDSFPGEDRKMTQSPKVATYDLQPEMSAAGVRDSIIDAVESDAYDFIMANFANGDMVGHTGVFAAAVKAVETVDACLADLLTHVLAHNGAALVTADHGNAEEMLIPGTDQVWTAHTTNPVPVVLVAPDNSPLRHATLRPDGRLADVAPTILELMGLPKPDEMTGKSLIQADEG